MQDYINTDRQLHWLCQVIAKANRTYVENRKDDSHTSLYFDSISKRIYGQWIGTEIGKIVLSLNVKTYNLEWINHKLITAHAITVFNKSMEQLEKEVAGYLLSLGLDNNEFFKKLHFEIPVYKTDYISPDSISATGIEKWCHYRELANYTSLAIRGYLQSAGDIHIWPHHFDTGIYMTVNDKLGIGYGLAMEDAMIGQPYFYISGYSGLTPISFDVLPPLKNGRWISGEHWNGAVLPLDEIPMNSYDRAKETILHFIKETSAWFLIQQITN